MKSIISPEKKAEIIKAQEQLKRSMPKRNKIWSLSDIDESKEYMLVLTENEDGFRDAELREFNDPAVEVGKNNCLYLTEKIPLALVISRDKESIADEIKLQNGSSFGFLSSGKWLTAKEIEEFENEILKSQ